MSEEAKRYNDYGLGTEALDAVAAALFKLQGACGFCEDQEGSPEAGSCVAEHFLAHAEQAVKVLVAGGFVSKARP